MSDEQSAPGDARSPDDTFEQQVQLAVNRQVLFFREFSLSATMVRPARVTEDSLLLYGTITLEELGLVGLGLGKVAVKFVVDRDEAEAQGFIPQLSGDRRLRYETRMDEEAARLEEALERGVPGQVLVVEPEYVRADYLYHERMDAALLLYGIIAGGGLHGCRIRFTVGLEEVARWARARPEDEEGA